MKGVSIVIPTYNRARLIAAALDSLARLVPQQGLGIEVLVVDNNSIDQTREVTQGFRDRVPVKYVLEEKQGLNHARNRALREALYEHIVYLDDDMEVDPGWLEGYVEAHAAYQPDAVTGPVEPRFESTPPDWMTERVIQSVTSAYSDRGDSMHEIPYRESHQLPGCNFAVLRSVALDVGGFNPGLDRAGDLMLAGGDSEFGERLAAFNKKLVYVPKCRITHFISNEKLSVSGLERRWQGLGATSRRVDQLHGRVPSQSKMLRLGARIVRYHLRSRFCGVKGMRGEALQWRLHAIRLHGYLFPGADQGGPWRSE